MARPETTTFKLPGRTLLIVLWPIAALGASIALIGFLGLPREAASPMRDVTGHAEVTGRLMVLATWLLLTAMTIGCLRYFISTLRSFATATGWLLFRSYIGLALFGIVMVLGGTIIGGPRFIGPVEICHAFGAAPTDGIPSSGMFAWLDRAPYCPGWHFQVLWGLNEVQKLLLALLTPALVLGTISCLAKPPIWTAADCRFQLKRLKTHLYLTAAVLVAGLLFLSALLRWPGLSLPAAAATPYKAHVDAYVLYWGVTYSIFIASYYVPVAVTLMRTYDEAASTPAGAPPDDSECSGEKGENPESDLLNLFNTLAALFAPAIAGLLGGVLHL